MKFKNVAIVAEWLTWRGGSEAVIDALLELFPKAKLYTTVYNEKNLPEYKHLHPTTSFLQKIPLANKKHQSLPPLLLKAIASLNLEGNDLIISSSSSIGKGITKPEGSTHICYCHTPMRYVWQSDIDNRLIRLPFGRYFQNFLKKWDIKTNKNVDYFICNSKYTRERIRKFYNREATVIYPPVDVANKSDKRFSRKDYYLCISRLIPYKRFDLAIRACNKLKKNLIIAGDGPEFDDLRSISGPTIRFVGRIGNNAKIRLLNEAKGLIFPAEEDFGIVPIEAMAQGTPVIAYKKGGVMESVTDGKGGVLFDKQDVSSLKSAIIKFERTKFDENEIKKSVWRFSRKEFEKNIKNFVGKIKK